MTLNEAMKVIDDFSKLNGDDFEKMDAISQAKIVIAISSFATAIKPIVDRCNEKKKHEKQITDRNEKMFKSAFQKFLK